MSRPQFATALFALLILSASRLPSQTPNPDPADIVRRSAQLDAENYRRLQNYTFTDFSIERYFDKHGKISSEKSETTEVLMLAGRPYSRVIARNGKPLSENDQRKEQKKLDKELAKRQKESEKDRAKWEKDRAEDRKFLLEIPKAFNLTLVDTEAVDGHPAWKIHAEPRPGYHPSSREAKVFPSVRGDIWIDQQDLQWVRADIDVIKPISWGLFILKIKEGGRIHFEQTRVNDEVWVPKSLLVRADAKLALLKTYRAEFETRFRDYRRFSTESQILSVEAVDSTQPVTDRTAAESPSH